jgi:hypothetical protein
MKYTKTSDVPVSVLKVFFLTYCILNIGSIYLNQNIFGDFMNLYGYPWPLISERLEELGLPKIIGAKA